MTRGGRYKLTPLLFILVTLSLLASCVLAEDEPVVSDIDSALYFSPVRVQILSKELTDKNFTDPSRNYIQEYREAIYSFFSETPMNLGSSADGICDGNLPLSSFARKSDSTHTEWMFTIQYNSSCPEFYPYDTFGTFASFCGRDPEDSSGACQHIDGGVLRIYVDTYSDPSKRSWLYYFDSVLLECCDGTWKVDRQACPDCKAKNYLPLILGCTLGFVGLITVIVSVRIACRVHKRRKRGITDAGHKPPPKNIGPAFQPHKKDHHDKENHHPQPMMMMRADHMGHHASSGETAIPPPVVVTIHKDEHHGKHKSKREEPDAVSTPEDDGKQKKVKGHRSHDKH